ncbi:ribokinase [Actinopolymorpha sp. NPDC004070]|uniref:ribokinase n=1 Tax=Actinopolymorpha sp. NPDC004070 TaxID=3154548 RepID=UPI0033ABD1D2
MGAIAVVGSVNQDLHLRVESLPSPGETVLAETVVTGTGGKGANQAVAVVASGGAGYLVGAVGDDAAGAAALEALRTHAVHLDAVHRLSDTPTGTAVVTVDACGQNNIVVAAGANALLTPEQVTCALNNLPDVTTVLAQCEVSPEAVAAAAAHASSAGARFVLNLAPYRTIGASILKQCDPLVVNEVEATALGRDLGLAVDNMEALSLELAKRCPSVVITLGPGGALLAQGATRVLISAPAVHVVDTTGAGDAFVGALAAQLAESGDLEHACRAGVAAGSRAVQHHGALP